MKKLLICVLAIFLLPSLFGCNGFGGDWEYPLPNGYAIWRVNTRCIHCNKQNPSGGRTPVLDLYVAAFCHDDRYVGLQCVDVPEDVQTEIDTANPDYYLLDTLTGQLSGPMDAEDFPLSLTWLTTKPAPEGAEFS